MRPDVLFPDAVLWACTRLRDDLAARSEDYAADVYVGDKMPTDANNLPTRADRMVILRRDGGPRLDAAREAVRLGIRVWATTDQDVNDLARMVRALLWAAADGSPVVRVDDQSGPADVPDDTGQPCRYLVVELIVRGSNLN
jgi:hypothetical protein